MGPIRCTYTKIISTSNEPQTSLNIHDSIVNASLDSDMNILQYKEETSFTIPTNISDLSSLNTPVTQHEGTNTHSEVQPHDRKDKICRKVMDETTLRIYFPRHVDTIDTISTIHTMLHYQIYWNVSIQFQHFPKRKLLLR